jgi:pseudaminic acid synthase
MEIDGTSIGPGFEPYFIAEMSNNHLNDIVKAKEIIMLAKLSGADAVKIQTYCADSLTINCKKEDFEIKDPLWKGRYYYELYEEISAPLNWTEELFSYAKDIGISIFSSPFDSEAVHRLKNVGCPAYKIASFESQDPYLIHEVLEAGKPVIFSTGISTLDEIQETLSWIRADSDVDVAALHCVSAYPSTHKDVNLNVFKYFKELGIVYGLSDHSLDNISVLGAISLGASIIEKHFTVRRCDGGPDAEFSLEPDEFSEMVSQGKKMWRALGTKDELHNKDRQGLSHGRSIYIVKDIKQGELITKENVRIIRPGYGLKPKLLNKVLGKRINVSLERGTALAWEYLE